jgi:hypothetical protein
MHIDLGSSLGDTLSGSSITNDHPEIAKAENLAQRFRDMVKNRKGGDLDVWLESAETSGIPEFSGFAMGIRRDHATVVAGIDQFSATAIADVNGETANRISSFADTASCPQVEMTTMGLV